MPAYLLSLFATPVYSDSLTSSPTLQTEVPPRVTSLGQGVTSPASDALEEVLLAVRLNDQDLNETVRLLRRKDGQLLARGEDFQRWRLRLPPVQPLPYAGEDYYPLSGLAGLSYRVDASTQELLVEARPELFLATVVSGMPAGLVSPTMPPLGGFINYDLSAQRMNGQNRLDGVLELGLFNRWGVGVSDFLGRDLSGDAHLTRLETTWTRDRPDKLTSLRLGDTTGQVGAWGRPVLFGGLQWGTNFATQPSFVTFPLLGMSGEAALPSTLELYANNVLRLRRQVPPGPFTLNNLPVTTGQGEVRLVVRDPLGREHLVTQSYYASSTLLRQGLQDYSYELGAVRQNFGLRSNDYGRFLAVGTHRLGLTDSLTGEVRAEVVQDQRTAGVGGSWLWPPLGVLSAAVAGSQSDRGAGGLLTLSLERQARLLSFAVRTQMTSPHFTQLGLQPGQPAPRQLSEVHLGFLLGDYGSVAFSYLHQDQRDQPRPDIVSGSYNLDLGKGFFLTVSAFSTLGGESIRALGLTLTRALGERTSATVNATAQRAADQATLQVQRNLPVGSGVGYRLLVGEGATERLEAEAALQTEVGTYTLGAARFQGQTSYRLNAVGGVAILGKHAFFSRAVEESFAVAQVPDYPQVRVYADNQLVARTDKQGYALLPRVRPYQENPVRIEAEDLPLDAQIGALELEAVPYFRSGVLLTFPVKPSGGALLSLVLDTGTPVPAGAVVKQIGQEQEFPVALRGEVYVTGLAATNRLQATWRGLTCTFTVEVPANAGPVPHLGPFLCPGVKP